MQGQYLASSGALRGTADTQNPLTLLLRKSTQVRVMAPIGKPNPRLPLLGLTALIANNLQVRMDGEHSRFRVYKSLRSTLSDLYDEYLT